MSRHKCGCGQPAVKLDGAKAGVCGACDRMESRHYGNAKLASDLWLAACFAEVNRALDAYWQRKQLPEPGKEAFNEYEQPTRRRLGTRIRSTGG